ncbi:hypothetical protein EUX98_g8056 [Antrodiella citrinella]|uniref:F-box domain-containing protein n=2 Tax=Antrodiella citrinella TaxID=2447956 RepID=A0A4S4MCB4_9APHY|nr:hypothetical protein EUX98_g8056 [Antrodiella citrinella]
MPMQRMQKNVDFLTYLKEVHVDIYKEDLIIPSHTPGPGTAVYTVPSPTLSLKRAAVSIPFPQHVFPIHLLAYIFDFLHPSLDARTLLSCLTTCRAWYLPAQVRLYRSIVVSDERSLYLLWERLSDLPYLSRAVREVRLRDTSYLPAKSLSKNRAAVRGYWENPVWLLQSPRRLAQLVPYAEFLTFEHINWEKLHLRDDIPSHKWLSQWMSFPPLQQLTLHSCVFSCFHEFELVIMSLPTLDHLHLDSVSWGDHAVATADALRTDPRRRKIALGSLTIGYSCDLHSIATWILATSTIERIKRLDILAGHEGAPEVIAPFVNRFRATLQHLTIGCEGMAHTLAPMTTHMNFHGWPQLHTYYFKLISLFLPKVTWIPVALSFALPGFLPPYPQCPTISCTSTCACAGCLTRLTTLRVVVLDIPLADAAELENTVWDQIMWILAELVAGGSGLRIVFVQRGSMPLAQAEWVLKRRMGAVWPYVEVVSEDTKLEFCEADSQSSLGSSGSTRTGGPLSWC